VAPARAYALHDSFMSEPGLQVVDNLMTKLTPAHYARLPSGETVGL
jgi:hypothetical protein